MARGVNELEAAVAELARSLDSLEIPYMVIGGFAVTVWGEPRLTRDVDATIQCDPANDAAITELVRVLPSRSIDPVAFVRSTRVLPVATEGGVHVDLIFAGLPYELGAITRALAIEIGGYPVKVCTPEDLIILKIISQRPRDREDITSVVRVRGNQLDRGYLDPIVKELSEALEDRSMLEFYTSLWRS
jgi:hypothetical protein